MKEIAISLALAVAASPVYSEPWTSTDGRTIEADFVRMDTGAVIIKKGADEFRIPLERLDAKSRGYAQFLHDGLLKATEAALDSPIIPEETLLQIIGRTPRLAEGKNFLIEGRIGKFGSFGGFTKSNLDSPGKVDLTLSGGTVASADLSDEIERRSAIKIKDDTVVLDFIIGRGAPKPDKVLRRVGDTIYIRASVEGGKVVAIGGASSQEVTEARLLFAQKNGGLTIAEAAEIEKVRIRMRFLEAQLSGGNAGTATVAGNVQGAGDPGFFQGTVVYEHSDAEKAAMREELELLRARIAASTRAAVEK